MALKKCRECAKEVSTEAKVCPNCGVKNPTNKTNWVQVGLIFIVGWFMVTFSFEYAKNKSLLDQTPEQIQEQTRQQVKLKEIMKTRCKKLKPTMDKLLHSVADRSENGNQDFFVNELWGKLKINEKEILAKYMYDCYGSGGSVRIHNAYTGAELAKYGALGFRAYEK